MVDIKILLFTLHIYMEHLYMSVLFKIYEIV